MENKFTSKQVLLSICIPTYNRCEILKKNLMNMISLQEFDNEVQLVVSDNSSTDNTEEIVNEIIKNNPSKNIKYIRNKKNFKDLNFFIALSNGDGVYCKLLNDYIALSDTSLCQMKDAVRKFKSKNDYYLILCLNYTNSYSGDNIDCINEKELILTLHNKLTWISNFGCYRNQLGRLEVYLKYWESMLLQIYWHINLAKQSEKIIIYPITQWSSVPLPNTMRKSPYNFFKAHVANYYDIINSSIVLNKCEQLKDKNFLLSDFVGKKAVDYLILRKECPFDLKGSWKILWKYFGNVPYLYIFIPMELFFRCKSKMKLIIRQFREK